jgi:hypothetical protein
MTRSLLPDRAHALALSGALLLGSVTAGLSLPAHAEVKIAGTPAAARIVADHDPIADVLAAMAAAFNVRYRTSVPLDGVLGGTYAGSLGQVIARVLDGYSFVVRHAGGATEIVVLGRRGTAASTAVQPPAAAVSTFAAQWR